MRGKTLSFLHIVQHTKMERGASRAAFPRGAWERSIGRHQEEIGWLSGRLREQARSYSEMGVPARDWLAVRLPSRASLAPTVEWGYLQEIGWLSGCLRGQASLLQWNGGTCRRLVGCQAAFAGKPRSYSGMWVPEKRLVGCQAAFASRLAPTVECGYLQRDWSAVRPPSRASLAPTRTQRTAFDSHHSSGRALARLQLLILIYPPLSGG